VQVQFPAPFVDWGIAAAGTGTGTVGQGSMFLLMSLNFLFFVAKSVTRLFETVCIYLLVLVFAHCLK
jgi:hypothetical protein